MQGNYAMTNYSYILFNQSPQQLRQLGARGGRATARNRRLSLLAQAPAQPPRPPLPPPVLETPAEAIAALDAQFPWLRGAEKRKVPRRSQQSISAYRCGERPLESCA